MSSGARATIARSWFGIWVGLLAIAVVLSLLVEMDLTPDETAIVTEVQGWPLPGEAVSDAVRMVTSSVILAALAVVMVGLHWLTRDRHAVVILLVLIVALPLTQAGLKETFDRPRPTEAGIEARATGSSASFPAGHVMGAVVVYGWAIAMLIERGPPGSGVLYTRLARYAGAPAAASMHIPRWRSRRRRALIAVCLAVLVLTGPVNVYLGMYWPTDVLGGYLWGAVLLVPALALARTGQAR